MQRVERWFTAIECGEAIVAGGAARAGARASLPRQGERRLMIKP
jgi:hypothetical protein